MISPKRVPEILQLQQQSAINSIGFKMILVYVADISVVLVGAYHRSVVYIMSVPGQNHRAVPPPP